MESSPATEKSLKGGQCSEGPEQLIHSPELNHLNQTYSYSTTCFEVQRSHSLGGRILSRLRNWAVTLVRKYLLSDYLQAEAEFHASLVRCLNEISRSLDTRNCRIDDEYRASLHSLEKRLHDSMGELQARIESGLAETNIVITEERDRLNTLESVARGLERIVARLGAEQEARVVSPLTEVASDRAASVAESVDYSYMLLENRFRGDEADIRSRLGIYAELFSREQLPVLEIGSGRGELQSLLRAEGVASYGTELDEAMVAHCQEQGLDVRRIDGISHLASLDDRSLGGVVAIQVIEHLSKDQLSLLLRLCADKVREQGKVVLETINTESLIALSQNYFRDPTHVWPLHPETMCYLVELAGLKVLEVRKLSPFPDEAVLQKIALEDYMTPRWKATIELLNYNFESLNKILYSHQDYCVIAEA